ncbi:Hpt domain-containing protein [Sphingomonas japonica]|uniref:HPt (Histidine-containing phosphotransfer) domain-containing protein n=1 Tax=Sphingomonas japonica TaxID=511662 RepID=A0ABX0U1A7_9SPHN|nr:Hpt domain-containing protein [Sphingomonas japonica]NIJ23167.1 HPt (histidine-containing phosphotransfer) domain-containing protein [Sphingomonas japonica]
MSEFEARMEALRSRFRDRAVSESERLTAALIAGDRSELRRACHSLTGNAGMFGFPELSRQAALTESAIEDGECAERIEELTRAVVTALDAMQTR